MRDRERDGRFAPRFDLQRRTELFWNSVHKTEECWLWTGPLFKTGYGRFSVRSKPVYTHRFAYESEVGPIPEGLFVCHRCDVRNCVRPGHLFLGTQQENMDDMWRKDRSPRGERRRSARLTAEVVCQMRRQHSDGRTYQSLADEYGVSLNTAWKAIRGETWGHVS